MLMILQFQDKSHRIHGKNIKQTSESRTSRFLKSLWVTYSWKQTGKTNTAKSFFRTCPHVKTIAGIYLPLLLESLNPINNLLIFKKDVSNILITFPSAFNCNIFFLLFSRSQKFFSTVQLIRNGIVPQKLIFVLMVFLEFSGSSFYPISFKST